MNAIAKSRYFQQSRIQKHAGQVDEYDFFNLLTGEELFDIVEGNLPDHRERRYPPTETLSMFLSQAMNADRSCQGAVNSKMVKRVVAGLPTYSTRTGSYCKARQRLPKMLVKELVLHTGAGTGEVLPQRWLWKGRPVKLIDGTTATMPDTPANQAVYPQQRSQKPGLGFPICRILGVICLASGCIVNAAMGPYRGKGASEHGLLRRLIDTFKPGDIILGDAIYSSYFLLCELKQRGADAIFERHGGRKRVTDFRKGVKLGKKDHIITYTKPAQKPHWMTQKDYDLAPEAIEVREIQVGHKVLVTTLLCPSGLSKPEIKSLYKSRWHVELDLRNIKTTLGMEVFSCKSPEMVEKEMWVYFLAYNLIRLIIAQSAKLADMMPRQISFKHSLQLWHAFRQLQNGMSEGDVDSICVLIAENTVGNRPGRVEPRAVKRRPKPYTWLTKTREEARLNIREHGHPKKQKR